MTHGILVQQSSLPAADKILTPEALEFLASLQRKFGVRRLELLRMRSERQKQLDAGVEPDFLKETAEIRQNLDWKVAATPPDLLRRWVEITGPTDRKMMINALNSGADAFMADFEDANSPTWSNLIEGQANLISAIEKTLTYTSPDGKSYRLNDETAVLMVRPRGWHLPEKHVSIDDENMSASLFDFGLYFFHCAKKLIEKGTGPYFYLPKLESHLEARLWNDVFIWAQDQLGIPRGTIRATVLIETILAAFEMEEILYELREHSAGLNAGRWDYIFSIIKKLHSRKGFILPDRSQITMTVPFMRAYTALLVKTCHRRNAHAIGGMAAFIPSRKDKAVNEIAMTKVREDKIRESQDGFDGTWVAHPDLVPLAREIFAQKIGDKNHQRDVTPNGSSITKKELLNFQISEAKITEKGLRHDIQVSLQYLESWLRGIGAVGIYQLMEDAATVEISRALIWLWIHSSKGVMDDGCRVSLPLFQQILAEEFAALTSKLTDQEKQQRKFLEALEILQELVMDDNFPPFLTLLAYARLN